MSSNFTIAEEYTLPSKGIVYSQNVNPVVTIKSMTTQHEMQRLAPSERPYKNICAIIDDCLVDNPGISSYDMCLSDYQFLLHKLRVVTYGADYKMQFTCPYCKSTEDAVINLDSLKVVEADNIDFSSLQEFILPQTKKKIVLKMQTPRIIDDITVKTNELKKKSNKSQGDPAFLFTLINLIDTVDGKKLDAIEREKFAVNLPMRDTNYIMKKAQKLVESFGIDTSITRTCPVCGLDYTGFFRITKEFFGPTIDD